MTTPKTDALREVLQYLVTELNRYAAKNGLGPARLMHALCQAEAALANQPEQTVEFDARAWLQERYPGCPITEQEVACARAAYTAGRAPAPAFDHLKHIQRWLTEMYQTMVDPVEEFAGNIEELCALLLKRAREDRQRIEEVSQTDQTKQGDCQQAAPAVGQVRRLEAQARLEQFYRMKKERPIDPCYWDMHEERELKECIAALAAQSRVMEVKRLPCGCEANNMSRCPVHDAP